MLEDAFLAEHMALLTAKGVDEGPQAEAAGVEGLDRVLPKALSLRPVPELPLLVVCEEREVAVVLRVPLRHPLLALTDQILQQERSRRKTLTRSKERERNPERPYSYRRRGERGAIRTGDQNTRRLRDQRAKDAIPRSCSASG